MLNKSDETEIESLVSFKGFMTDILLIVLIS